MIELSYQSDTGQIIRAAFLYFDYHLSNFYWQTLTVLVTIGTLFLIPYYWTGIHLDAYWILIHLIVICVVFGRYRLSRLFISKGMVRSDIDNKAIHINLMHDKIEYKAETTALHDDIAEWKKVPLVLEAANGYVVVAPCGRFIWIPFSAFSNTHTHHVVRQLFHEKHIRVAHHPEWSC